MNRSITLPAQHAREFAKASAIPELIQAVEEALGQAWSALTILAEVNGDGDYDFIVRQPSGVMVAWMLPEWVARRIAIPGGEHWGDLHLTLAYLGQASAMSVDDQRKLIGVVAEVASRHSVLYGQLSGLGRFTATDGDVEPLWVGVNIPGLQGFRAELVGALLDAGLPVATEHDFSPHITVAYIPKDEVTPKLHVSADDLHISELTVAIGGTRHTLDLINPDLVGDDLSAYVESAYRPDFTKAVGQVEEARFTMGPWYVPNQVDAHGEWTDPEELQKALWGYVRKEDRRIRLQHERDIVAGEWVEAMSWPFEVEVPLTKSDGTVMKYRYPEGTPFLGVVWEPWAWELVKAGKLSGFSIGGRSERIEVDLRATEADLPNVG